MYKIYSQSFNTSEYKQIVYVKEKLEIETYIIGYRAEGESILFFIKADGIISFSGLVDCYKLDDVDKVNDILRGNKIDQLNFICWTHPDLDHSKGLKDIIFKYASSKTAIWIPEGVDVQEITCSKEVKELFTLLRQYTLDVSADLNVYSASDKKDLLCYSDSICFQKDLNLFPLKITSYAPNSKIIRKQNYLDKFIKNDRSIFLVVALGSVRIYLTGDIEDESLDKIPANCFDEHIHILKIPHHGSDSSEKMLELGWNKCDVACCTVYRKGNSKLPLCNIMDQYDEMSDFLICTGKFDKNNEACKYGMIKITTDVVDNHYSTYLEGNAVIWNAGKANNIGVNEYVR